MTSILIEIDSQNSSSFSSGQHQPLIYIYPVSQSKLLLVAAPFKVFMP